MYLDKHNVYQPDICFIAQDRLHLIQENGLHRAPDLVIEILSPATAMYDLAEKKDVYECYGGKEYWIIDPADKSVTGLVRENDQWVVKHTLVGRIDSGLLDWQLDF